MKQSKGFLPLILGLGAAWVIFSSFKKGTTKTGSVYVGQSNAPTGSVQVYSKVGTNVYDQNMNLLYTYDTENLGMTNTGVFKSNMYSVVIGSDFMNGVSGFVYMNDVNTI